MSLYVVTDYWVSGYAEGDGGVAAAPYPGPAGGVSGRRGKPKKKPWIIGDRRIVATREEVERILAEMLQQQPAAAPEPAPAAAPAPSKVAPKDRAIVAAFPNYPDLRDMLIAAQQVEAAQALRAIAQRLADEEDERDVELLLMHS